MNKFNVGDLYRLSYLKRWQILGNMREQSVAEHSWNVQVILLYLLDQLDLDSKRYGDFFLLRCAAMHDFDEFLTGDIPSNVKTENHNIDMRLNRLIGGIARYGDKQESSLYDMVYKSYSGDTIVAADLLKLADLMDAIAWLHKHHDPRDPLHLRVIDSLNGVLEIAYVDSKLTDKFRAVFDLTLNDLKSGSSLMIGDVVNGR